MSPVVDLLKHSYGYEPLVGWVVHIPKVVEAKKAVLAWKNAMGNGIAAGLDLVINAEDHPKSNAEMLVNILMTLTKVIEASLSSPA